MLHQLGLKYGTDKATFHDYCRFYEAYLPHPSLVTKVMELGVLSGKSLNMWKDYYYDAMIYGVDIEPKNHLDQNRIKTIIANQSDRDQLREIINKHGKMDIIIDDGGHTMQQQQRSLATLISNTNYYVIEDLCTSLLPLGKDYGVVDESCTTLSGLMEIMRGKNPMLSFVHISYNEVEKICSLIDEIHLFWNYTKGTTPITAIIKTKVQ